MKSWRSTQGELIEYKGLWIRKDTTDIYVPGQLNQYNALYLQGQRVLDLGAHIGGFVKRAFERGAVFCMAVEPVPENYELLYKNAAGTNTWHLAGIVRGLEENDGLSVSECDMYISNSDTTGHTAYATKGRKCEKVYAFTLGYILGLCDYNINVVKMDIEGAEYGIMYDAAELFPKIGVQEFAAELHLNRKGQREKAREFVELFDEHYEQAVPVKLDGKHWNTTGVWRLRW